MASAVDEEEEKAKEALENFLATHEPSVEQQNTQPARRGVIEKKSKDEAVKEVKEILKRYGVLNSSGHD